MNPNFLRIIAATPEDRRGLFLATANRLGTPLQNVEKDFWVTWILDLLFNGRQAEEPRLLFKGGTSLSKAYGLISRFSEDIDITVFREDLGQDIEVNDLEGLSGKQQRLRLEGIKQACQSYIQGPLLKRLNHQIKSVFLDNGIPLKENIVVSDPDDADGQTLLVLMLISTNFPTRYVILGNSRSLHCLIITRLLLIQLNTTQKHQFAYFIHQEQPVAASQRPAYTLARPADLP